MEDSEIEMIIDGGDLDKVSEVIDRFLNNNENVFSFPNLNDNNKRAILWTALFQHIQNHSSSAIHAKCLAVIRILSRDKTELESLLCEKWITILIERAGLYSFTNVDDESMVPVDVGNKEVVVEALKCLCNITFNSEVARALCAHSSIAQGLVARLRVYKDLLWKEDIMLFDMKLIFILTVLRPDIKSTIKDELHGLEYLISCLNELVVEACSSSESAGASCLVSEEQQCILSDNQQAIVCEILKAQFNLTSNDDQEPTYQKLVPILATLLTAHVTSEDKLMELRSNVANLLTNIPPPCYAYLTPDLNTGEESPYAFDDKNMVAMQSLLELLQYRLTKTTSTRGQYESLSPILTVLGTSARAVRSQRRWLRRAVLPPLRDVSAPPERGRALRNQLCRLLTTPVTAVRDLVADFLFVLCKEKVGRMVKYTGFGNAAGHLAQNGLLGGGRGGGAVQYSSSSEDSDTEEYARALPNIDPVVGCTRPPRTDPFAGMTEEQKEHEAMKMVNLLDKMVAAGVVTPARVGPDGRPQPISHVLEFREHAPNRSQS